MKVYLEPVPITLSRAMHRVANALRRYAPESIEIVTQREDADFQVVHAIGYEAREALRAPRGALIQYCYNTTTAEGVASWQDIWKRFDLLWSYYDLSPHVPDGVRFFYQPLGVDDAFLSLPLNGADRTLGVLTSGFLHGTGAEAIEEPALAADLAGLSTVHLGPQPVGMTQYPRRWKSFLNVTDSTLAAHYRKTLWVSGLRHVEGFELPVIEGLACGCRPVVFDREETRRWFNGHAVFVKESEGQSLVDTLAAIFMNPPDPVTVEERATVLRTFSWKTIAGKFWTAVGAE